MSLSPVAAAACAGALAIAVGVAACGDGGDDTRTIGGDRETVDIYSSLPLQGASEDRAAAMVNGIELALEEAGNESGGVTIRYESLDDSTAQTGAWDAGQTAHNARTIIQDEDAVGYIGDLHSGASAISIPILNEAGIAQISPSNTYVGLTTNEPGAAEGEPGKYYPTGQRTYLRLVPRDTFQAAALLTLMRQDGCRNVAIAHDGGLYAAGLARLVEDRSRESGVYASSDERIGPSPPDLRTYAQSIRRDGADCFLFVGVAAGDAVRFAKGVAAAIPDVRLYGSDGVCDARFASGVPASIAPQVKCTLPAVNLESVPAARDFLNAYQARYGDTDPDPYAVYGYEAMRLFIDALAELGDRATDREAVLEALFETQDRESPIGTYSFDANGDTTLTAYGVYEIGDDGDLRFAQTIEPEGVP